MAQRKKRTVTDEHKAAMAQGRTESRAVSAYLEALESHKPKRGRKRTPDSINKRLGLIEKAFVGAAKGYSDRKRISYTAWRELGVPPEVLKKAGVSRAAS